jgi:hypothetical protein
MYYWCGVAFGFGLAFFLIGMEAIATAGEGRLSFFKYGGALLALGACIGV